MTRLMADLAPTPGEIVDGKYEVVGILGRGGMGVVVEAKHLVLHERVAIKTLLPELAADPQSIERFLREARAVAKIQSTHVARVLDVLSMQDGSPCIVMEYLEGEDLERVLEHCGRLPYTKAVDYVLEACEAIAEAHALGIVHRDLKPSNLFLAKTRSGVSIKVLDFGISKLTNADGAELALTRTKTVLGSPLYMSPEQLRSARSVDARSDIWSIGAILFELIAGRPPFDAESIAELGALVLTTNAPSLASAVPETPEDLVAAVATCLQRDPADRFVNLADFAAAITRFGGDDARVSSSRILKTVAATAVRAGATPRRIGPETLGVTENAAPRRDNNSTRTRDRVALSATPAEPQRRSRMMAVAIVAVLGALALVVLIVWSIRRVALAPGVTTTLVAPSGETTAAATRPLANENAIPSSTSSASAPSIPSIPSISSSSASRTTTRPSKPTAVTAASTPRATSPATSGAAAPAKDLWDPR